MAKVKVRRTNREELPGIAVLRDSVAAELAAYPITHPVLDLDMDVDPDLLHLMGHDPDGFFTAILRDETLGFAAAHVRSKQCVLSELWVLPQHHGKGAGEALLSRALAYGERSGARSFLAVAPVENNVQSLLLRHELAPKMPIYLYRVPAEVAPTLSQALTGLLAGQDMTAELFAMRGQADIDRIDRLTRNIERHMDHDHWLKVRGLRAAFVRQGDRIAAYAYGGANTVGPVAGATQDAALCALGWSLRLALKESQGEPLYARIPAAFQPAVEILHESGARLEATLMLYGRGTTSAFDRYALGSTSMP